MFRIILNNYTNIDNILLLDRVKYLLETKQLSGIFTYKDNIAIVVYRTKKRNLVFEADYICENKIQREMCNEDNM